VSRPSKIAKRTLAFALLALALLYTGDFLFFRLKVIAPRVGPAFGTVKMERLYAIPQKNGKIDYEFDARQPEVITACVNALFPRAGYDPCWYLQRISQKPIPM
jgi:hypothetical protein